MKPASVELHIDELVLHGVSGIDEGISEAVSQELTAVLNEHGVNGGVELHEGLASAIRNPDAGRKGRP